jgi:hypothetical protein
VAGRSRYHAVFELRSPTGACSDGSDKNDPHIDLEFEGGLGESMLLDAAVLALEVHPLWSPRILHG